MEEDGAHMIGLLWIALIAVFGLAVHYAAKWRHADAGWTRCSRDAWNSHTQKQKVVLRHGPLDGEEVEVSRGARVVHFPKALPGKIGERRKFGEIVYIRPNELVYSHEKP